jgi:signal transduction histidine kinase
MPLSPAANGTSASALRMQGVFSVSNSDWRQNTAEIPGPLTASQREVLEVVRGHSERLFQTISSVLDLSKMEAGMMEYSQEPTDLGFLIERSVETVRLIAQKKRIQLESFHAEDLPLMYVDEQRIRQVLDAHEHHARAARRARS